MLKVSRITHVYAQAVVKFWVLGSCPIFQLWKKVSSFIVTTSQLVPSVQTIVYAVSRKEFAFMKRNVPEEALVFTKGVFAFCIFETDEKLIGLEVKRMFSEAFSRARMN